MKCKKELFPYINQCKYLKLKFPCHDCETSMGNEQPVYVNPVSEDTNAGKCLINSNIDTVSCEASHLLTMRLCPCI